MYFLGCLPDSFVFLLLSAHPYLSSGFEVRQLNVDRIPFSKKQKAQDEEVFTIQVCLRAPTIYRNWLAASACRQMERISFFEVRELLVTKPFILEEWSKAPFMWRKVVPCKRVTLSPLLPWASQLFLHILTKLDEPLR